MQAGGLYYDVPTGRRDGRVSEEINVALPSPSSDMKPLFIVFKTMGFSLEEMVTLLGNWLSRITLLLIFTISFGNNIPEKGTPSEKRRLD